MLINVRDIEEKLKKRPVGTVDWYKFFSVTIPLIETEEGLSMVFEVRAAGLKTQPGDICFPGGRMEEGETALQCALRELKEETGISPSDLRVLGQFDTLHEFSGHTLYTFAVSLAPQALQKARTEPRRSGRIVHCSPEVLQGKYSRDIRHRRSIRRIGFSL